MAQGNQPSVRAILFGFVAHMVAFGASIAIGIQGVAGLADALIGFHIAHFLPHLVYQCVVVGLGFAAGFFVNWLMNATLIPGLVERGWKGIKDNATSWWRNNNNTPWKRCKYLFYLIALLIAAVMYAVFAFQMGQGIAGGAMIWGGVLIGIIYSLGEFETLMGRMAKDYRSEKNLFEGEDEVKSTWWQRGLGLTFAALNAMAMTMGAAASLVATLHLAWPIALALALFVGVNTWMFYSTYLADVIGKMWAAMKGKAKNRNSFHFLSLANIAIGINALCNAGIAYFAASHFLALSFMASLGLPTVLTFALTIAMTIAGFFASYFLGQDFWIEDSLNAAREFDGLGANVDHLGEVLTDNCFSKQEHRDFVKRNILPLTNALFKGATAFGVVYIGLMLAHIASPLALSLSLIAGALMLALTYAAPRSGAAEATIKIFSYHWLQPCSDAYDSFELRFTSSIDKINAKIRNRTDQIVKDVFEVCKQQTERFSANGSEDNAKSPTRAPKQ